MWVNPDIWVIICNDADSERSKYCGKTEWFANISYEKGKEIFANTTWNYLGKVNGKECWHTFNQEDAEKYTLGNFQGR